MVSVEGVTGEEGITKAITDAHHVLAGSVTGEDGTAGATVAAIVLRIGALEVHIARSVAEHVRWAAVAITVPLTAFFTDAQLTLAWGGDARFTFSAASGPAGIDRDLTVLT
jgi:hypothetical protein